MIVQNLEYLSSDLEGRSRNTVSVMFDMLTHPGADIGIEETSLLEWKHYPERAMQHVVLGKSGVGGAWQVMQQLCVLAFVLCTNLYTVYTQHNLFTV